MKSQKALVILTILAQAAFAQQEMQQVQQEPQQYVPQQMVQQEPQQAMQQEPQEPGVPIHTITVDFGPTIMGFIIGALPGGGDNIDISGLGFSAQYERQIFERLSIAGRFAYLGIEVGYEEEDNNSGDKAKLTMDLSSFSLEAHPRVYPFGSNLFLDGMIGYADMTMEISGSIFKEDDGTGKRPKERKSFSISRGYFKYGVKVGWRIDFGEPGGLVFEHSYGWYNASGMGDTMGKQMARKFDGDDVPDDIDKAFSIYEDYIFIGGPRMTLALGWKF